MAYAGMTQEQFSVSLQNDNAQLKADMMTMKQLMEQASAAGTKGGGATGTGEDWHMGKGQWYKGGMEGRVVLDQKQFRCCDKFEGNPANFKSWMFDLITAVGSVD